MAKSGECWLVKISVLRVKYRGSVGWMVSHKPPGAKRKRSYFTSKADALAEKDQLEEQKNKAGTIWLGMSAEERNALAQLHKDAKDSGVNLRAAFEHYKDTREIKTVEPVAFGAAVERFLAEMKLARFSAKRLKMLRSVLTRISDGKETNPLETVTRSELLAFLGEHKDPVTFNTYLGAIRPFFKWAVETGKLSRSPAESIKSIGFRQMLHLDRPPAILTPEQCKKLLEATRRTDKGFLPYIAVCMFAGLRPEREAGRLTWSDIKGKRLIVRGPHAKTRQRREIEIQPNLRAWLDLKGDLPPRDIEYRFKKARAAAGLIRKEKGRFIGWEADTLRHTFASYHLATFGAEKTIAALGHGNYDMLFRHYRDIVTAQSAKEFWSLRP